MCDRPARYLCGCVTESLLWCVCERWVCDRVALLWDVCERWVCDRWVLLWYVCESV